jgi:hypothetical protein
MALYFSLADFSWSSWTSSPFQQRQTRGKENVPAVVRPNIADTFTQRRQRDRKYRQAIDDPDIDGVDIRASEPLHFSTLQKSQNLRLHSEGQFANFIEE